MRLHQQTSNLRRTKLTKTDEKSRKRDQRRNGKMEQTRSDETARRLYTVKNKRRGDMKKWGEQERRRGKKEKKGWLTAESRLRTRPSVDLPHDSAVFSFFLFFFVFVKFIFLRNRERRLVCSAQLYFYPVTQPDDEDYVSLLYTYSFFFFFFYYEYDEPQTLNIQGGKGDRVSQPKYYWFFFHDSLGGFLEARKVWRLGTNKFFSSLLILFKITSKSSIIFSA